MTNGIREEKHEYDEVKAETKREIKGKQRIETKLIAHEKRSRAIRPNYRTKQQQNKTNIKLGERASARAGARRKQQIISRQSKSRAYTKASSVH